MYVLMKSEEKKQRKIIWKMERHTKRIYQFLVNRIRKMKGMFQLAVKNKYFSFAANTISFAIIILV